MREYFPHDYNARNDRKIAALVRDYRSSGYGIFWSICEMMHEEGDRLDYDEITFDAVADNLKEDSGFIKEVLDKCISKYKLFILENNTISSNRVKKNLNERDLKQKTKSESGRLGGIKSGESRRSENKLQKNEAPLEANEAPSEAPLEGTKQSKVNKSKVKESKEEEIIGNEKKVNFEIKGLGEIEILFYSKCEVWQENELISFLTKSQGSFESIAMRNKLLNNQSNFNIALQEFVNMIQGSGDYKESQEYRRYFNNWLNRKNGTLEEFIKNSKEQRRGGKKVNINSFL